MSKKLTRKQILLDQCYDELEGLDPTDNRYSIILDNVYKLETKPTNKPGLSKDTFATLVVYAGLTVLIVVVEIFGHSLTSRALSAIPFRPRI